MKDIRQYLFFISLKKIKNISEKNKYFQQISKFFMSLIVFFLYEFQKIFMFLNLLINF